MLVLEVLDALELDVLEAELEELVADGVIGLEEPPPPPPPHADNEIAAPSAASHITLSNISISTLMAANIGLTIRRRGV
jgi:hypothetical protein